MSIHIDFEELHAGFACSLAVRQVTTDAASGSVRVHAATSGPNFHNSTQASNRRLTRPPARLEKPGGSTGERCDTRSCTI
ncbi:hypothetical protein CBOM_07972 [Ceraceosorus bombacis]|uniref:Uncharacterized protein n=1 Tax=Ceraceosorus bombacis TaxID=401625 RepID=A0A0P1BSE3_9BASI|nr:hypothetical protein CBOM_07972 [Ceraceosorus bombacis]